MKDVGELSRAYIAVYDVKAKNKRTAKKCIKLQNAVAGRLFLRINLLFCVGLGINYQNQRVIDS